MTEFICVSFRLALWGFKIYRDFVCFESRSECIVRPTVSGLDCGCFPLPSNFHPHCYGDGAICGRLYMQILSVWECWLSMSPRARPDRNWIYEKQYKVALPAIVWINKDDRNSMWIPIFGFPQSQKQDSWVVMRHIPKPGRTPTGCVFGAEQLWSGEADEVQQ